MEVEVGGPSVSNRTYIHVDPTSVVCGLCTVLSGAPPVRGAVPERAIDGVPNAALAVAAPSATMCDVV